MGKTSKKRKRKKYSSSSSSEEDEKKSRDKDVTKNPQSAKRREDVTTRDSHVAKQEKVAYPPMKDVSQSSRQIKKPVYRLSKTQATDQKPVNKEEERTQPKSVSVPLPSHRANHSSKAKNDTSGKYYHGSGSKTVERRSSKPSITNSADTVRQRRDETCKDSSDEKSSQRTPSKIKKPLMSPSLVSAERKEQAQNALKRMCRAEEPPRTRKDNDTIKTKIATPSKTSSVSKDSVRPETRELLEVMCQRYQDNKLKTTRSPYIEAKTPSASTPKRSSTSAKHTTSVSSSEAVKNVMLTPGNFKSVTHKMPESSCSQQMTSSITSARPVIFKIQKKVQPRTISSASVKNDAISTNKTNISPKTPNRQTELSNSGPSVRSSKQDTVQQAPSCLEATPSFSSKGRNERASVSGQLPAVFDTVPQPRYDQRTLVEELHLARSEKRLELNVMQSYGELTCMDIDPPEEAGADTLCKQPPQQDLILVLDTNILLSHLDYVKKIRSHGLGVLGFPVVLIPWVVLQEMDSLKRGRGLTGSVAHLATPAISYIYNSLKGREPRLWGQSMQQATQSTYGLNAENNDDRVLQCCLQYQTLYQECALILCTNDKNLCSKALLSGVKALNKNDLEAEAGRSAHGFHPLQNIKGSMLPHINPQVSLPMLSTNYTPVQPHSQERAGFSVRLTEQGNKQLNKREDEVKTKWDLSTLLCELEDCLREVLSDVLEVEMKAAYEDLWLEIVYLKPPWTLQGVLQCLKKHWIAVFGQIVPRGKQQTVSHLMNFFNSGEKVNCSSTLAALREAKELVKAFGKRSSRVPGAISALDNIFNKLQRQAESPACDVVMNDDDDDDDDDDEDTQPSSAQVSHQEVWALFENIWSNVFQISLEVFKALGFDPRTMQSAQTVGGPPPPQDALVCLHKLSSMLSQLLQAFSSVLSSAPGLAEVQTLLSIIQDNKIVNVNSRLTAKDLLDCFSQQEYREKLRVGGSQLMELKGALDRCVGTTSQHITFPT